MKSGSGMIRLSRAVTCSVVMLLWIPVNLFGRGISLEAAVAIAVEKNPELAVAANKLLVARGELQRANYMSQCNPKLVSNGDYRHRAGRSNAQEWRIRLSQELGAFEQPALRRRSAALGYQRTQAEVRNQVSARAAHREIARLKNEVVLNRRLALPNPTLGTFFGHDQNPERFGGLSIGVSVPIFNRRQAEATAIAGRLAQSQQKLRAVEFNIEHEGAQRTQPLHRCTTRTASKSG
jgi:hypothetical protein